MMMEHGVEPDGLIGVSAGAAFGCNYKSRQIGRAIRYNTRFAKDARYSGIRSLLRSGNYFNAEFGYHVVPYEYDIFDTQTFEQNPMKFTVVCTDVLTGQAVYHDIDHVDYVTVGDRQYKRQFVNEDIGNAMVERLYESTNSLKLNLMSEIENRRARMTCMFNLPILFSKSNM